MGYYDHSFFRRLADIADESTKGKMRKLTVDTEDRSVSGLLGEWDFYDDAAVWNKGFECKRREAIEGTVEDRRCMQVAIPYMAVEAVTISWEESVNVSPRPNDEVERLESLYGEMRAARAKGNYERSFELGKELHDAGIDPVKAHQWS